MQRHATQPQSFWRIHEIFDDISDAAQQPNVDRHLLKSHARWIRDDLDPLLARDGPNVLPPKDISILSHLFDQLFKAPVPLDDIRWSRIHCAVTEIAGRASRWPSKLIEKADALISLWSQQHGSLVEIGTPLYDEGGRLHGISTPDDVSREVNLVKWMKTPGLRIGSATARSIGDVGFKPGDPLFAYRDGIIDSDSSSGTITADKHAAYAVLLAHEDEVASSAPDRFTYRASLKDSSRYRLTAATPASRHPIRILRSHTLRSFWAPRAGIRYDGLHRVVRWTVKQNAGKAGWSYEIDFQRLETETPMSSVLLHPSAEEVDDYKEYKRIRKDRQQWHNPFHRAKPLKEDSKGPAIQISKDASGESFVGVGEHFDAKTSHTTTLLRIPRTPLEVPPATNAVMKLSIPQRRLAPMTAVDYTVADLGKNSRDDIAPFVGMG